MVAEQPRLVLMRTNGSPSQPHAFPYAALDEAAMLDGHAGDVFPFSLRMSLEQIRCKLFKINKATVQEYLN